MLRDNAISASIKALSPSIFESNRLTRFILPPSNSLRMFSFSRIDTLICFPSFFFSSAIVSNSSSLYYFNTNSFFSDNIRLRTAPPSLSSSLTFLINSSASSTSFSFYYNSSSVFFPSATSSSNYFPCSNFSIIRSIFFFRLVTR